MPPVLSWDDVSAGVALTRDGSSARSAALVDGIVNEGFQRAQFLDDVAHRGRARFTVLVLYEFRPEEDELQMFPNGVERLLRLLLHGHYLSAGQTRNRAAEPLLAGFFILHLDLSVIGVTESPRSGPTKPVLLLPPGRNEGIWAGLFARG